MAYSGSPSASGGYSGKGGDVAGIVWPPVHIGGGAALAELAASLEESQWLSATDIANRQSRQLAALVEYAARQSQHFALRLQRAGLAPADLTTLEELTRLPVFGKREVQDAGDDLFCREAPPSHGNAYETKSSGSTGEPVVIRRSGISQLDWLATTLRDHRWHRRDFSLRLCAIRAKADRPVELPNWGPPVQYVSPSAPAMVLPVTMSIRDMARELARFSPGCLLAYPSILAGLVEHWQEHGMGYDGLQEIRLVGETFTAEARQAATGLLGVKLTDIYTSEEVGNIACQCPQTGLYHVMETLHVEILDDAGRPCEPGETGRVVVTDLRNFATPLLRYDLGDYAEVGEPCSCGRGLPTLKRIAGRRRNLVVLPDGERHWPQVGFGDYRKIAPIRQYQLIQHSIDLIEVRLVADTSLTIAQESALTDIIHRKLGHPFPLRFAYFSDRLPAGPRGKFEEFMCKL